MNAYETAPMLGGFEQNAQTPVIPYGAGPTVAEVIQTMHELEAEGPFTRSKRALKQLALSLAASIDAGNNKGRAVANEAAQLMAIMDKLDPLAEADVPEDGLTPATQRLLAAFEAPAQ